MFFCALGLFYIEGLDQNGDPFFNSFKNCLWWCAYTMATIGYEGVEMPFTIAGKTWALVLVGTGIALIGVFTATLVDLFIGDEETKKRLDKIEANIDNLTKNIDKKNNES